jgi:hypothetical protein
MTRAFAIAALSSVLIVCTNVPGFFGVGDLPLGPFARASWWMVTRGEFRCQVRSPFHPAEPVKGDLFTVGPTLTNAHLGVSFINDPPMPG